MARDHCTPADCAAFRALTDHHQIAANMDERTYDGLVARYAPSWNAPAATARRRRLRGAYAVDADGQAHQCRFSLGGLDPARQHHDAGAGHYAAARAAAGRVDTGASAPLPSPRPAAAPAPAAGKKQAAPKSAHAPAPVPACTRRGSAGARGASNDRWLRRTIPSQLIPEKPVRLPIS